MAVTETPTKKAFRLTLIQGGKSSSGVRIRPAAKKAPVEDLFCDWCGTEPDTKDDPCDCPPYRPGPR